MKLEEAIEALKKGEAITHTLWDEDASGFKPHVRMEADGSVFIHYGYGDSEPFSIDSMISPVGWEVD